MPQENPDYRFICRRCGARSRKFLRGLAEPDKFIDWQEYSYRGYAVRNVHGVQEVPDGKSRIRLKRANERAAVGAISPCKLSSFATPKTRLC